MPGADVYATYPDLTIVSADMLVVRGGYPSVCIVEAMPIADWTPPNGTLTFRQGPINISWQNTAVDKIDYIPYTNRGFPLWRVHILDKRWRWKNIRIDGKFNIRTSSGFVSDAGDNRKSATELFELLLVDRAEETDVTVDPAADAIYPAVDWQNASIAGATQGLLNQIAFTLVLRNDGGIEIGPLGSGPEAPVPATRRNDPRRWTRSDIPGYIEVRLGPSVFECYLQLEAVALENQQTDTSWEFQTVPLEQSKYLPPEGLEAVHPWTLEPLISDLTPNFNQYFWFANAAKSFYKWYRIKATQDQDIDLDGQANLSSIADILPLKPKELTAMYSFDSAVSAIFQDPSWDSAAHPIIRGKFYGYSFADSLFPANNPLLWEINQTRVYNGPFTLDLDHGLVIFPAPMYFLTELYQPQPAQLYLRTSFNVKTVDNNLLRKSYARQINPESDEVFVIDRPDLFFAARSYEDDDLPSPGEQWQTNEDSYIDEVNGLLDAYENLFKSKKITDVEYAGLVPTNCSGNIQSVRYSMGAQQQPLTRVTQNYIPSLFAKTRR